MCNVNKDISELTLKEIQSQLIIQGNNVASYPNEHLPSVEEYFELLTQYPSVHPVVELKYDLFSVHNLHLLIETADSYYDRDWVYYISFHPSYLLHIRELDSTIPLQLLTTNPTERQCEFCISNSLGMASLYTKLQEDIIHKLRRHSCDVNVWTVDSREIVQDFVNNNYVDYITSNYIFADIINKRG